MRVRNENNRAECAVEFTKANLRIESDEATNVTRLSVKPEGSSEWTVCMVLDGYIDY
jgi:hypothetical protein